MYIHWKKKQQQQHWGHFSGCSFKVQKEPADAIGIYWSKNQIYSLLEMQ